MPLRSYFEPGPDLLHEPLNPIAYSAYRFYVEHYAAVKESPLENIAGGMLRSRHLPVQAIAPTDLRELDVYEREKSGVVEFEFRPKHPVKKFLSAYNEVVALTCFVTVNLAKDGTFQEPRPEVLEAK